MEVLSQIDTEAFSEEHGFKGLEVPGGMSVKSERLHGYGKLLDRLS